jgi:hypothetical protein
MTWKPANEVVKGRALRNDSAYAGALQRLTQTKIASLIDVSDSTLSDNRDLVARVCLILAAAGLKVVPIEEITIDAEELRLFLKERRRDTERRLAELGDTVPGGL